MEKPASLCDRNRVNRGLASRRLPENAVGLAVEIGTLLGVLSLPLYWLGYAEGRHPVLGMVVAFFLGGVLVFCVSWAHLPRELRTEMLGSFTTLILIHAMVLGPFVAYMVWISPSVTSELGLPWEIRSLLNNTYAQMAKPVAHIVHFAAGLTMNQLIAIRAATERRLARRLPRDGEASETAGVPLEWLLRYGYPPLLAAPLAFVPLFTLPVLILTVVRLIWSQRQIVNGVSAART